ncbi:hypothetical protein PYCCODRAFT_595603 [Trametes coccinea BRFM310]|uniref:Uncharacterized protein n=1 Tax=Trametes coccinea (strain BRFM310) TaxID=1353009 RepID=A0A1Y2J1S2_TRAC3|nr:hypothetical protein PYCCODRAFT_595603 [Trametes coccinea BRFM310]
MYRARDDDDEEADSKSKPNQTKPNCIHTFFFPARTRIPAASLALFCHLDPVLLLFSISPSRTVVVGSAHVFLHPSSNLFPSHRPCCSNIEAFPPPPSPLVLVCYPCSAMIYDHPHPAHGATKKRRPWSRPAHQGWSGGPSEVAGTTGDGVCGMGPSTGAVGVRAYVWSYFSYIGPSRCHAVLYPFHPTNHSAILCFVKTRHVAQGHDVGKHTDHRRRAGLHARDGQDATACCSQLLPGAVEQFRLPLTAGQPSYYLD